jgi:hypothetical protein
MKRLPLTTLVSVTLFVLTSGGEAAAQYNPYYPYPTVPRPATGFTPPYNVSPISPYLNLRPNMATNYFLGTLPEFDRRAANVYFSSAITNLDQRLSNPPSAISEIGPVLNETGHPAYFGNYGTYYFMPQYGRPAQAGAQTGAPRVR